MGFAEGLVGVTLDERYRLEAVLGEGGMGAVYRATHLAMERKVAVKLLKPHLTSDELALHRFAREARTTLRVESPHAVKVLDFGVTPTRDYYMVLEYLDGRTVQRELDIDGIFAPARVLHIARQALHALGTAHAIGLVHRDIKPDNLLLLRQGDDPDFTKVLDFGVAKLMEGAARSTRSQLSLTQAGTVFGTPELMSPEQCCGHPLDGRSDLYSLAGTMFAMLTGYGLFEAKAPIEWLTSHVRTPPPHLADVQPHLAAYPELDALLQRCLAKSREARPANAAEMEALCAQVLPTLSRPPGTGSPSKPVALFSGSTFVPPLANEATGAAPLVEATAEVAPRSSAVGLSAARDVVALPFAGGATSESNEPVRRSRGGLLYLALAVVAVVTIAIVIAMTKRSRSTSIPRSITAVHDAAIDGAVVAIVVDAAVELPDAAIAKATKPEDRGSAARRAAAPDPHLAAAEEAMRAGNRLRQLAEADLALHASPKSQRAQYLLADALIKTGDSVRGCQYLQQLKRYRPAVLRAREAGCGSD